MQALIADAVIRRITFDKIARFFALSDLGARALAWLNLVSRFSQTEVKQKCLQRSPRDDIIWGGLVW
jgi:hypothetical protein